MNLQENDFIESQVSVKGTIRFELKSLITRLLRAKPQLSSDQSNFLNLGCGKSRFEGWVNADLLAKQRPDWILDLRYPLNCHDNVWDGVFSEHTLEHLYPSQAANLLKELNRTMKPGSWLRISVPDLKKYINYYCGQKEYEEFSKWSTGCEAVRSLTQNHFHLSLWDSELLKRYLNEAGFIKAREVSFMAGSDVNLLKDKPERMWESLYVEAQKPV